MIYNDHFMRSLEEIAASSLNIFIAPMRELEKLCYTFLKNIRKYPFVYTKALMAAMAFFVSARLNLKIINRK